MNLISETFTITVYNLTNKKAVGACNRTIIYSCSLQVYKRNISISFEDSVDQRFSTWGTRTPRGTWEAHRGYAKFKKTTQNKFIWVEFFIWGVREGGKILIWGYAEGYNPD